MIYTKNKEANNILKNILELCNKIILDNCKPTTILLAGSYARGEGLVVKRKKKIQFISDIDLYILGPKYLKKKIPHINADINNQVSTSFNNKLDVNIQYMDIDSQHDDLSALDLKYQTILLYGTPIHKEIHLNENRALRTSIRFLMAKSKYLLTINKNTSKEDTILACSRSYAEIITVLSAKAGIYKPTYQDRCNIVKKVRFNKVNRKLIKRAIKFTQYKLGHSEKFTQNKDDIFKQAIYDLFSIWTIILGISTEDVIKADKTFRDSLTKEFFSPFIEESFDRKFGIQKPPFMKLWLFFAQLYDLIPFLILSKRRKIENVYIIGVISPYIAIYQQIIKSLSKSLYSNHSNNIELVKLWDLNARRRYHF